VIHEPEHDCIKNQPTTNHDLDYCICEPLRAAYRRGYNDHARAAQHWQDTHGAYRACPWFVTTVADQRIYCTEAGEHTSHVYPNVFTVDRSEYQITIDLDREEPKATGGTISADSPPIRLGECT
jgi:hypothetical protein